MSINKSWRTEPKLEQHKQDLRQHKNRIIEKHQADSKESDKPK